MNLASLLRRISSLSRSQKLGLVIGGYLLAVIAGYAAGALYDWRMAQMPYDTSGGMYAFGEMSAGLGVFLMVALAPTLLAAWFLRRNRTLWFLIALGSLAFAVVGLIATLMPLVVHQESLRNPVIAVLSLFTVGQLLGMPLWIAAFVLFAFLAPAGQPRRLMFTAIAFELVTGVFVALRWLESASPF